MASRSGQVRDASLIVCLGWADIVWIRVKYGSYCLGECIVDLNGDCASLLTRDMHVGHPFNNIKPIPFSIFE